MFPPSFLLFPLLLLVPAILGDQGEDTRLLLLEMRLKKKKSELFPTKSDLKTTKSDLDAAE